MINCGQYVGGVVQGAVCEECKGTTFVEPKKETVVEKVKEVLKKKK